jgi:hypothetical protein
MTPLATYILNNQDKVWSAIQDRPEWRFLKSTCDNPHEVIEVVNLMGWQTLQEALEGVAPLNALSGFLAEPAKPGELSFDRDDLKTVGTRYLLNTLFQEGANVPGNIFRADSSVTDIFFTDEAYGVLSLDQIKEIAAKSKTSGIKYNPETMDCDDFAFAMNGWLASMGLGNVTKGFAAFNVYQDGALKERHATMLLADGTGDAWWVEPQTGEVFDFQDPYWWPNADKIVLTDWIL